MSMHSGQLPGTHTAEPANIVIFGATGDLTKRKLMPALVRMMRSCTARATGHASQPQCWAG